MTHADLNVLRDVPAPAKINHFLHIVGRRADGYHRLQSLFVLIDWQDTLHFQRRSDGALTRRDLSAALPADDLSLRAARSLQAASGTPWGVDIEIDKQVPWGAGLGGGSSDAATTLIALNRLWGLHWPRARLAALGETLGADVPFFIGGRAAIVEGIGEQLTPVALAPEGFLIVKPAAALATADVFRHPSVVRDTPEAPTADILAGFLASVPASAVNGRLETARPAWGHNDLQRAAVALCPDVGRVIDLLSQAPPSGLGQARMSGSGSAVFSRWAQGKNEASGSPNVVLATLLKQCELQGWTARVCRSLDRHPLDDWLD